LDALRDATEQALDVLQSACPNELPSTPTGRMAALRQRIEVMLHAVAIVRPALVSFYRSLNDEQQARFNALAPDDDQQQVKNDLSRVCNDRSAAVAPLPIDRIDRSLRLSDSQRAALDDVQTASTRASEILQAKCPDSQALTPTGRIEAMQQRLEAMLQA